MKLMNGRWLFAFAAMGLGLAGLSLVPGHSLADDERSGAERNSGFRKCVYGPGIDTHVLDEETLLAKGAGRGGVLIKVEGCRLTPYDILVFEYHGAQQICDPLDVQLSVRDSMSPIRMPCFIQSVTPVSPDEVRVLEKQKYQPTDRGDRKAAKREKGES